MVLISFDKYFKDLNTFFIKIVCLKHFFFFLKGMFFVEGLIFKVFWCAIPTYKHFILPNSPLQFVFENSNIEQEN